MNKNLQLLLTNYIGKEGFKKFLNIDNIVMFSLKRSLIYTYDDEQVHMYKFDPSRGFITKYIHNPSNTANQNTMIAVYDIAEDKIVKGLS